MIMSLALMLQFSPNFVHPMPTIATLSLMLPAIVCTSWFD